MQLLVRHYRSDQQPPYLPPYLPNAISLKPYNVSHAIFLVELPALVNAEYRSLQNDIK